MIKKILTAFISIAPLILNAPALANWPVAIADKFIVHGSQPTKLGLLDNDIGRNLKVVSVNEWSEKGARISIIDNKFVFSRVSGYRYGDVLYRSRDGFSGMDGFWYVIEDDQGRKNAIRVVVNVKSANSPLPAPQNDFYDIPKDKSVRINPLSNDLFNEQDVIGDKFRGGAIVDYNRRSSKGGKVEKIIVYPDVKLRYGSGRQGYVYTENTFKYQFKYTPPAGFVGVDTFTYAVRDGKKVSESITTDPPTESTDTVKWTKVTLNVGTNSNNRNPWPVAYPDKITLNFSPFTAFFDREIDVLKNDQGGNLLIKLGSAYSQKGGRVKITPNHANHPVITYDPPFDNGVDRIWYSIEDEYGRRNFSYVDVTVVFTR